MAKPQSTGNLVNALAQDSSNNIGIGGAANASFKLQVTGATNLTGALSGTSATFSGAINLTGTANTFQVASIFRNANRVFFGGDTGGYFFQNSANSATIFQIADSGAATFSSSVTAGGYLANGSTTIGMPIDTGGTKAYFDASSINGAALTLRADGVGRTLRMTSDGSGTVVGAIDTNSSGLNIGTNTSHPIIFNPQAIERMRITQGGNVGIGTSSPSATLDVNGYAYFRGASGIFSDIVTAYSGADLSLIYGASGNLLFKGGSGATERMRITSGGRGLFGTTTPSAGASGFATSSFQVQGEVISKGSLAGFFWENRSGGTTDNSNWYGWYTTVGTIFLYNGAANAASINSSTGAYTALNPSDIRIKDNVRNYDKGLNELLKINVKEWEYNGKAGTFIGEKGVGFVANELEQVIPEWVGEFETYLHKEDTEKTKLKNININELPYLMLKAIQEQQAKIESQDAKIEELKALIAAK